MGLSDFYPSNLGPYRPRVTSWPWRGRTESLLLLLLLLLMLAMQPRVLGKGQRHISMRPFVRLADRTDTINTCWHLCPSHSSRRLQ